jgi:hypothetical protein
MMFNLFGRQVSLAVLWMMLVSFGGIAGGVIQQVINGWSTKNPEGMITLISGGVMTLITGGLHIWDTMPGNIPAPAVTNIVNAPAAPSAAAALLPH